MRDTAAVVVTYNRIELLKQCIAHLQNQTVPVDIIVIDNASTDGTADLFAVPDDNLFYFNTGSNLGGAGGFNYGMRKAVEMGYKFVWVMDDDTMPNDDAHEKLIEADKELNGEYGWLSSLVLWTDGTPCNMNIQKITKWKKLEDFNKKTEIQYASFVSLFLKGVTIRKYGLPYKDFFIWGDDWEYTRRISKSEKSYYIPESTANHFCKDNNGSNIVSADKNNLVRYGYSYRNDVVVYRQDGFDGFVYMLFRIILHSFRVILKADGKSEKLKVIFVSVKEGISFKPKIEYLKEKV